MELVFNIYTISTFTVLLLITLALVLKSNSSWRQESHFLNLDIQQLRMEREKSQAATAKHILSGAETFISEYFKNDLDITDHIIKVSENGKLSIKIGNDSKMVDVDLDSFSQDPVAALESAKMLYKAIE